MSWADVPFDEVVPVVEVNKANEVNEIDEDGFMTVRGRKKGIKKSQGSLEKAPDSVAPLSFVNRFHLDEEEEAEEAEEAEETEETNEADEAEETEEAEEAKEAEETEEVEKGMTVEQAVERQNLINELYEMAVANNCVPYLHFLEFHDMKYVGDQCLNTLAYKLGSTQAIMWLAGYRPIITPHATCWVFHQTMNYHIPHCTPASFVLDVEDTKQCLAKLNYDMNLLLKN